MNRLPYDIASSPAIRQRTVDGLFSGIDGVMCFVDDVLIAVPDMKTHNERLTKVLSVLLRNHMHIKAEKCNFAFDSVSYLGFRIDCEGIHKTSDKIHAIKNIKAPTSVTDLRSFQGLVNFYGKFVPGLSTTAAPLNNLLRKDQEFEWSKECDRSLLL